jgi:hypothetical protein
VFQNRDKNDFLARRTGKRQFISFDLPGALLHTEGYPSPISHIELIEIPISQIYLTGTLLIR